MSTFAWAAHCMNFKTKSHRCLAWPFECTREIGTHERKWIAWMSCWLIDTFSVSFKNAWHCSLHLKITTCRKCLLCCFLLLDLECRHRVRYRTSKRQGYMIWLVCREKHGSGKLPRILLEWSLFLFYACVVRRWSGIDLPKSKNFSSVLSELDCGHSSPFNWETYTASSESCLNRVFLGIAAYAGTLS